ncbi:MAG TPA: HAD-IB family hydrolase [Acidimicrobiales bacterium]
MSEVEESPASAEPAAPAVRPRPGVAAFDFDGTLARHDTLIPFLRHACGERRVALAVARGLLRTRDRDALKLVLLARLFAGWPEGRLRELGGTYATTLPAVFRPEVAERLAWHRGQGHAVVIVSASLGAYLRPLADALGLDGALAVEMVADGDGILTGDVEGGANTRGPGKVARLRTWLDARYGPDADVELWAYGDSAGDRELLAAADHPTWVGRAARRPPT